MNQNYIKYHNYELWKEVTERFPDAPFMEALYRYQHNIDEPPRCTCGNPLKFRSIAKGYYQYCSKRCSNSDPDKIHKSQQTNIERYGGPAPACSKDISQKIIDTARRRHGADVFKRRRGPLQESTKEKMKKTCLERYGVENVMHLDEFRKKCTQGRDYKETSDKVRRTRKITELEKHPDVIDIRDHIYTVTCPHNKTECRLYPDRCSGTFDVPVSLYAWNKKHRSEQCTNLLPIDPDRNMGTGLELFVRNILDSHHISYIANDRSVLDGKELDIYIPSRKLAIECNGVYWHSLKEPSYHFNKWKICKNKDIQLLTIWEDQIINNPLIIENIIRSRLGMYEHRIGARKCDLKKVSSKESDIFLKENHLQGSTNGSVRLGLYYNDELVSIMVFGHKRRALGNKDISDDIYELYRYCNKIGWQVMGGASRLFNHFLDSHPDCMIESFSSNDISVGDLYRKLGFELVDIQKGSYWYIDREMNRHHRYSYRKDVLVKNGADPSKTEFKITDEMGLMRIYDSGQQKWIYK